MSCKTIIVCVSLASVLLAADAAIGTWKLNPAKSKFGSGPHPQSATVTYEETGNGVKRTGETVNSDGQKMAWEYTAQFDAKDYPITGNPTADAIALKRIDDRTVEATLKKGGNIVSQARRVVSKDGKTLTLTIKSTNEQGQKVESVQVYDKQ